VGTLGDKVTADEIKKYIRYQHHAEQLELFTKGSKRSTNKPSPLGGGC